MGNLQDVSHVGNESLQEVSWKNLKKILSFGCFRRWVFFSIFVDLHCEVLTLNIIFPTNTLVSGWLCKIHLERGLPPKQDMLEVRCLERLELQGKRLEDVAKRMEHLEDSNKNLGLQMANPTEQVATSENWMFKSLSISFWEECFGAVS